VKIWLLILSFIFWVAAWSYPAYIGYGYASCRTCHYNPLGNGLISNYGRAVQASEISGNLFGKSKEDLANSSSFPLLPTSDSFSAQASYRGLYLRETQGEATFSQWIHMQAEAAGAISFSKKFMAAGSVGYVPLPENFPESERTLSNQIISREHYLAYIPKKGRGFYLGLMDVAFGLRIPDHNAFIRSTTFLNINDQTHGLLFHEESDTSVFGLHLFLGKLSQDSSLRQKGASLFSEFSVGENQRIGASLYASESDFRSRQMIAFHSRHQLGKGSSLLAELALVRQSLNLFPATGIGSLSFFQYRQLISRGFFGLLTVEHFFNGLTEDGGKFIRFGPSIEYLPMPRVELRFDFLKDLDSFQFLGQTHIWL